ncbi:uncharacterized protein M421DRAFT_412629 [Didymella exigua CBS 183.55]|uniref:Uncharacterized protein n=1 Tax=Didymella exigua CBS 183.55 TaxID=1150837 RepID=A0A6A5RTS5_9PLEO|nr:uncharacterized protein M421DRAFT_412629 [Didymella exigua CBS 183.55]KAF1930428.1 hypothetical protein M421DRAFT_412629 [Didymella exigua CBS 183.55]
MPSTTSEESFQSAESLRSSEFAASVKTAASAQSAASFKSAVSAISTVSRTSTVVHTATFKDAVKFAEEFHSLSRDLDQARATQTSVEKLTEVDNFRIVDWAALEETWALDHNDVHKKLEGEIEAKIPAFEAAKEGLDLLDEVERRAWWKQCQLKYSSMTGFFAYTPANIEELNEEEVAIEDDAEVNSDAQEFARRRPSFENFDPWWVDENDKEGREIAEVYSREQRKDAIAKWAARTS